MPTIQQHIDSLKMRLEECRKETITLQETLEASFVTKWECTAKIGVYEAVIAELTIVLDLFPNDEYRLVADMKECTKCQWGYQPLSPNGKREEQTDNDGE